MNRRRKVVKTIAINYYHVLLKNLLLFFCLTISSVGRASVNAKVLIFTYCYNRPDFIEMQLTTLKKFLENDFSYIVFNDAKTAEMSKLIINKCRKLGVRCIRIPQHIHNRPYLERPKIGVYKDYNLANVRNSNVVQWSLNNFGFLHNGILILLDGDIFLSKPLNVVNFLKSYDVAGFFRPCYEGPPIHQCKILHPEIPTIRYLWIGLVFLNIPRLPNKRTLNFNCGFVEKKIQVDAGGYTYYYLKNHPNLKLKSLNRLRTRELNKNQLQKIMNSKNFSQQAKKLAFQIKELDPRRKGIEFYENDLFVHYFGGTNYYHASQEFHDFKTNLFKEFILEIVNPM